MKSTGEVMGIGRSFGEAFAKAQLAAGNPLPHSGKAFISVRDADKVKIIDIARDLQKRSFSIVATRGTSAFLAENGIPCERVHKVGEGRPHIVDKIKNDEIHLIVNTTEGRQAIAASYSIRREALMHKVSYTTTIAGARAACSALAYLDNEEVNCLQELHKGLIT
jgi:carbamoyl-phosphate synthase large subunit